MNRQSALHDIIQHPLFLPLYVPSLIYMVAQVMLLPVLPLYAADFGVDYGIIGLIIAADGLGLLTADIPGGILVRRLGQKRVMQMGLVGAGFFTMMLFWATSVPQAILLRYVAGMCGSLYMLARYDFIASNVTTGKRGRAIALFGGVHRLGKLAGPLIGAGIAGAFGLRVPFLVFGLACIVVVLLVTRYVPDTVPQARKTSAAGEMRRIWTVFAENRQHLLMAGTGQIFVMMIRTGTQTIVPLYGQDVIGLDVEAIGLIMSVAAALDMLMFFPAGMVMDRKGRKYAIVPSFIFQAVGMALLPFSVSFVGLLASACIIGFANGLSSGTMMTIGADLAPPNQRSEFLGIWRLIGDAGASGGPLAVGSIANGFTLHISALIIALTGGLAAAIFAFGVPETLKKEQFAAAD